MRYFFLAFVLSISWTREKRRVGEGEGEGERVEGSKGKK